MTLNDALAEIVLVVDDFRKTSPCCTTRWTKPATPCWWPPTANPRSAAPVCRCPT